eukprot:7951123-Pyramimonas_sp.AAC.1
MRRCRLRTRTSEFAIRCLREQNDTTQSFGKGVLLLEGRKPECWRTVRVGVGGSVCDGGLWEGGYGSEPGGFDASEVLLNEVDGLSQARDLGTLV